MTQFTGEHFKYRRVDDQGEFDVIDAEGISHPGLGGFIGSIMGWCGCGCPEEALELLHEVLEYFADDDRKVEDLARLLGGLGGLFWTYLYMLDDRHLIEHGSAVSAAWLTDEGKELLGLCREWRRSISPDPSRLN